MSGTDSLPSESLSFLCVFGSVFIKPMMGQSPVTVARQTYELPIRIPVRNTSTPPTTTWKAAERKGVSI